MSKRENEIATTVEAIREVIQPGDVITQVSTQPWWKFWDAIIHWGIQYHQRKLFGRDADWHPTHAMLFFDEERTFSVEVPRVVFKPLAAYCLEDFAIWRLQLVDRLTDEYLACMMEAAETMLGEGYDYGQVLDMFINRLLGYADQRRLSLFDLGRRKKVCSVGVRVIFEYLYSKKIKTAQSRPGKWLFYHLAIDKWPAQKVANYKGTDVEATTPAHFSNSHLFANEFRRIARFRKGVKISE